ncbi:MAG TPA: universal stress protein [Gemmatimonadaceae bacterium]|nr:universal stress protein [Gemmatimonadaceae bacterium]
MATSGSGTGGVAAHAVPSARLGREQHAGPILVATDGGRGAARLIEAALSVGAQWQVGTEVVSVLPPSHPLHNLALGMEPDRVSGAAPARERRRALEQVVTSLLGEVEVSIAVHVGTTPRVIADVARRTRASLIVMGRHLGSPLNPRPGFDVTARTVRLAPCPVLALGDRWRVRPRRIAVACDFGLAAVWAAETAARLVHPLGRLDVLHVLPLPRGVTERSAWGDRYNAWCETQFALLRALLERATVSEIRLALTSGEVAPQLLVEARSMEAWLLATGSSGAGAVERLLVGSVAATLLAQARCDVLVAPPPPPGELDRLAAAMRQKAEHADADDWAEVLDAFSVRNQGRPVWVESADTDRIAVTRETGATFFGATYDESARRVMLMLGRDAEPRRHATRSIGAPRSIAIHADVWGREAALVVRHEAGETALRFVDDAR